MTVSENNPIEVANVTLASLVKLVGLLSAELVVGKYREDIDVLESAIRRKLFATIPGASSEATAEGVALAHKLLDPMFRDLRARATSVAAAEQGARAARRPKAASVAAAKLN
ncbi:hypothetical protein GJ654_13500 [Rhodoblastus acidophilus]|uniref:Uncharacterized protein n=1 Tax=Rhodoblastus acidophilus TaxID=1074 RepID=A0A6N8DN29_RHOAC|nr:hypothetical protein [Rhodoblastus acidophilus]MCW2275441.1 hypothetical protein [Rhodoblastus acidophilus]MTV32002.1 hypothetical protein [Rhodoblastus acidophilus]